MDSAKVPPVKEGDEIRLQCENISERGDSVFKHKGFVIFVSGVSCESGRSYDLVITKVLAKVGFAKLA